MISKNVFRKAVWPQHRTLEASRSRGRFPIAALGFQGGSVEPPFLCFAIFFAVSVKKSKRLTDLAARTDSIAVHKSNRDVANRTEIRPFSVRV